MLKSQFQTQYFNYWFKVNKGGTFIITIMYFSPKNKQKICFCQKRQEVDLTESPSIFLLPIQSQVLRAAVGIKSLSTETSYTELQTNTLNWFLGAPAQC